ncbi:epimerase [Soonwooa sp.]|uniref:epimerase n=1 Tax=Soonwooa sp. TaxID=1938592 RepID=UPI002896DD08|nr:epimerase [Soonwooa sp.]
MKKIGIIGCGWLGFRMAKHFAPTNDIFATTTSYDKVKMLSEQGFKTFKIDFDADEFLKPNEIWNNLDVVIITIPFSKSADFEDLKKRFENLSSFLKDFEKQIFLMSSIGIYPQIEQEITENNLDENLLNPNIFGIENLMKKNFSQINILRLGGLMGDDRYLNKYKIKEPQQIVNHIHFEDISRVVEKMIDENLQSKTYNFVAPLHPTKQQVLDFQTKNIETKIGESFGRKIISTHLENDLKYEFLHPNPRKFK